MREQSVNKFTILYLVVEVQSTAHILVLQVNPPYYIPLVEIIPAPWTDQSVVGRTTEIMRDLGQAPVTAKKEINGFIVNRLQYALIMEAWRLVEVCKHTLTGFVSSVGILYM